MAINKVGSKGITDGAVASADFKDGDITSAKIGDGQVTNAKLTNSSVTLAGQSISLGGSVDLNVTDWQSVVTADGSTNTTAVSGQGYLIDTTSATHTINLPASANRGDFVAIKDYAGTFATNNLTIGRNGHNIQGAANDSLISTNRASLVLVYVDSTKGWIYAEESNVSNLVKAQFTEATGGTITESGDFKIHTFTGDGCFVVTQLGNSSLVPTGGPSNVDYLVIAGGAGAATAAGGAGGYRTTFPSPGCNAGAFPISQTTYPITVGGGGGPGSPISAGGQGSNSVFSTITSTGGGGGAGLPGVAGNSGGSGGGGANGGGSGGLGNTPPVSPSQGNNGGSGHPAGFPNEGTGGGGGAGAVGSNAGPGAGGNGGAGLANSITGSSITRTGGGGGWGRISQGSGGSGGGGNGGTGFGGGGNGTANTGGGGGGTDGDPRGLGGKGIVIIRYKFQ